MMMTSVLKLRIINMSGSLISLIYAICVKTWPVVVLNACLLCINLVQTARRLQPKGDIVAVQIREGDSAVSYLFDIWRADIEKCNLNCSLQETRGASAHIIYMEGKAIGFSLKAQEGNEGDTDVLYLTPEYRNGIMKAHALAALAKNN
jgi:hypothetical protein